MTDAVIVSTARTPLCKSWRGALNMTHGAKMGGHVVHAALERAKVDADEVEDVIIGCANPEGATGWNIARQIAIRAGCPVTVPGMTVNRFCSSGLQTIALASQRILAGEGDVFVAGGVESISMVQNEMNKHHFQDEWLHRHHPETYWPMLQTAEYVAKTYGISREQQDRYGPDAETDAGTGVLDRPGDFRLGELDLAPDKRLDVLGGTCHELGYAGLGRGGHGSRLLMDQRRLPPIMPDPCRS